MSGTILALDQGTTSSRAILFDHNGNAVQKSQRAFRQIYPKPGWVEHDPVDIWQSQFETAREVIAEFQGDILAIGITNQRETTLIWDRETGAPIYPAIVWQDRRTAIHCEEVASSEHAHRIREATGLPIDPYFSATKIAWILDHVDNARSQANRGRLAIGTVDSYLLWRLTEGQVHATDPTNASRTMLFDLRTGRWSEELCELFGVPMAILPEIRPSSSNFGSTSLFGREIPITGVAGDQHAATYGQACFEANMAKNTYGTGCFLLATTADKIQSSNHGLLSTTAWQLNGQPLQFALEGSIFVAGAAIQWLCDELRIADSPDEVNVLAQSVADTNGVVMVPAFTGLGAPHWDPYARGTILGLTRGSNRNHLCRAVIESIALQTADLVQAMGSDSGVNLTELRVDGGGSQSDFMMQMQADYLGIPVVRPEEIETTARGVAFLAGLAIGFWSNQTEITDLWHEARRFVPAISSDEREGKLDRWHRAINHAKGWSKD